MATRKYFGTDGVRGVAGREPMTAEFAFRLGVAAAARIRDGVTTSERPSVVIGMDTRRSGPMLAHAVAAGLTSRGVDTVWAGVLPTPGISYLTRSLKAAAGIVISASHNPFEDNGIKLFDDRGEKYDDDAEADLERRLEHDAAPVSGGEIGTSRRYRFDDAAYAHFLLANAPYLDGMRVGLDCANGAASAIAPKIFSKIGARLDVIHASPDGTNINVDCGSTHPTTIQQRVASSGLDVGVTFDGDADRALLVDRRGRLVTGDHILAICARVRGDAAVVATIMTNLGIEAYLQEHGVGLHRVQVGDRYVHRELVERQLALGGEQSGHVLFLDKAPTGDGILTALQVLAAVRKSGRPLDEWMDEIPLYPQTLRNVRVAQQAKASLLDDPGVGEAVEAARDTLGGQGTINLRPSGTEPMIRVMVQGPDRAKVEQAADAVVAAVERAGAVAT